MNKLVSSLLFVSVFLLAGLASADPESQTDGPGKVTLKVITIVGRVDKPHVEIILTRPTAASAANAAHDDLHTRLMATSTPKALSH